MSSLNKVQLIGNLTAEPEVKETPNGTKVASFSIATNRYWKDASGEKQEEVSFHNIVAWSNLALIIEKYVSKGSKVYVEGRLHTKSWEDQSGVKKYKTEIIVENLIMLSTKPKNEFGDEEFEEEAQKPKPKARPQIEEEISIEDIPF